MPTYISVLNSTVNNKYWKAVQVADSLQAIRDNRYFTAGVSTSFPKNSGDTFVEPKQVTEVTTGATGSAKVYKLNAANNAALKVLNSK